MATGGNVLTSLQSEGRYRVGDVIGKGGTSTVSKGWDLDAGHFVAIKRISLGDLDDESRASIETEIELLKRLHHDHIVGYVDCIREGIHLHIVLEVTDGVSSCQVPSPLQSREMCLYR